MIRQDLNLGHLIGVASDLRKDEWTQIEKFGGPTTVDGLIVGAFSIPGPKWGYVSEHDGKPLLAGGFIPQRSGVYQSWFLATDHAWKFYWKELSAEAVDRKARMFASGAHRIETVCLSTRKLAHRWYKTVGSQFESTLKAYCIDGSDADMFVDTKGGL